MSHNFPCTPEGGKISPHLLHGKSILGGISSVKLKCTACCLNALIVAAFTQHIKF